MNSSNHIEISANTTIGILGAGQLARMSAAEVFRMGMKVSAYPGVASRSSTRGSGSISGSPDSDESDKNSENTGNFHPLEWMTPLRTPGTFDDRDALIRFARQCTIVTLENEFLDGTLLADVEQASGTPVYPSPKTFSLLESKWIEKETFRKAGIPVTPYRKVTCRDDLKKAGNAFGYPWVLKSSKGGYDGYGNITIRSEDQAVSAFQSLGGDDNRELIAEAFIPFRKELAVQVARNQYGTAVYPCCETIQQGHICKTVIAPANIDPGIRDEACRISVDAVEAIDGRGLFAFEFFLSDDGRLLLNESAPRPHNSGHYSIEGCVTSQFENHIRAVMGLPLGSTEMRRPVAVMENLLGLADAPAFVENTSDLFKSPDAHLHIYGKRDSKKGRKMGHITLLGGHHEQTLSIASDLAERIRI